MSRMPTHAFPNSQQPVNFGNDDDDLRSRPSDRDTELYSPTSRTRYTSGFTVPDTSMMLDENGETRAQAVANGYRQAGASTSSSSPMHDQKQQHNRSNSIATSRMDALTYIDEDFNYYHTRKNTNDQHDLSLVRNAEDLAGAEGRAPRGFQDLEYSDPHDQRSSPQRKGFFAFTGAAGRYPIEQRIENKRRGIPRQKYPFVVWTLSTAMLGVFLWELARNWQEQGTPVSFHPTVNPMLGPSQDALINFGSRFPPCMKLVPGVPLSLELGCLNNTDNPPTRLCSLETICNFGGFHGKDPNQWWRFITPIFLHAGIVHIALNLFAQLSLSAQIERDMGSGGFFILYFAAGIFGNVLGGNFALPGLPSLGASGAIFGTLGVLWVDLFAHWQFEDRPVRKLIFLIVDLVIGFGLGFVPGVDNFSHIGGFLLGLLSAVVFLPVISTTKRHKLVMWTLRIITLPLAIILFVVLIWNFYTGDPYSACSWCRYLSCWPTAANNHCRGTGITTTTSN